MNKTKQIVERDPRVPAEYEAADIAAMQAVATGTATPEQQQRVINWLLYQATGVYDLEYRVDPRNHAFASGMRFIGLQIVKLLKLNAGAFTKQQ